MAVWAPHAQFHTIPYYLILVKYFSTLSWSMESCPHSSPSTLHSLLSTLYSLLLTLYSQYTLLSTLYSLLSTVYSLLSVYSALYFLLSTLYSLLSTLYSRGGTRKMVSTLYSLLDSKLSVEKLRPFRRGGSHGVTCVHCGSVSVEPWTNCVEGGARIVMHIVMDSEVLSSDSV